jgi:hypothetical protein
MQMALEFDQENSRQLKSVINKVDQEELVNNLVDLYLNYIRISKEGAKDDSDRR